MISALAAAALLTGFAATAPLRMSASSLIRLVDSKRDDQAYVAARVLSGESREADVIVLGTSSAREALWREAALQTAIERQGGGRLNIVSLASSAQSPIEMLFLATLRPAPPGQLYVLVLGFSELQLPEPFERLEHGEFLVPPLVLVDAHGGEEVFPQHWTSSSSRLLMRWRALRQWSQRQLRFGLRAWIREKVYGFGAPPYEQHLYANVDKGNWPDKALDLRRTKMALKKNLEANMAYMPRTLDVLAETLQRRGDRLAIVRAPVLEPELRNSFPAENERFETEIRGLAARRGIEILDWNQEIRWEAADSIDAVHVSTSGRDKWSAAFAHWLARRRSSP